MLPLNFFLDSPKHGMRSTGRVCTTFSQMRLKSIEIQPFGIAGFTIASKK